MTKLAPCSKCARHVRENEAACPFCGGEIDRAPRVVAAAHPDRRFARAAMMLTPVIAAGVASALVACGPDANPQPVALYGPPPMAVDGAAPTATDAGTTAPTTDAGKTTDTPPPDHGQPVALYGVPPVRQK